MIRYIACCLFMILPVLTWANTAPSAVQLYSGQMEILVTSGNSCGGLTGNHDMSLVVVEEAGGSGALHGYFAGDGITIGTFSGSDPSHLAVRYPFFDDVRATGHVMSMSRSESTLTAELHDRHVDAVADDCNFDLARMKLTRMSDNDAVARLAQMTGLFDAQKIRSQAVSLVQSSGYQVAVPYFEKALTLADTYLAQGSDQINSYIIGLATGYIWLERFDQFNRLFDTRIMTMQDESVRSIFSGYRVQTLMSAGRTAVKREDYGSALMSFEQASRLQPGSREIVAAVMSVQIRTGRYAEAVSFLERTEAQMENEADRTDIRGATALVLFKKAQLDDKNGHGPEAEAGLKRAMQLDPGSVQYLIALARLRHKSGSLADAETVLEEGMERFSSPQSQNEIVSARDKMRQNELFLKKIRTAGH